MGPAKAPIGHRIRSWIEDHAPWLHRFLESDQRGATFVRGILRDAAYVALVAVLISGVLWTATGQSFPDAPVVVVESGSMMHCENGIGHTGDACQARRYGRVGTIDPGDLVFIRDVDGRGDVATFAQDGKARYGAPGDVVVFQADGDEDGVPIIHRAMFWLEIHGDGTYSVPALGMERVPHLNHAELLGPQYRLQRDYHKLLEQMGAGPEDSGFITRGDNNNGADQGGLTTLPVQSDWILGKARGEVPWIGLVKLFVWDLFAGKLTDGIDPNSDYERAPTDTRQMMWVLVGVAVLLPFLVEWLSHQKKGGGDDGDAAASGPPPRDERR